MLRSREAVDQPAARANAFGVLWKQRLDSAGNGRGDFAVELLVDDRFQQRLENTLRGFRLPGGKGRNGS